jgi:ferredoxin
MKVLLLSTYEKTGGAAIAANRLLQALRKSGVDATMMCRKTCRGGRGSLSRGAL